MPVYQPVIYHIPTTKATKQLLIFLKQKKGERKHSFLFLSLKRLFLGQDP